MDGHLYLCLNKMATLPLTGSRIYNEYNVYRVVYVRAYELKIHGGTPFENGVELDPAQNIKGCITCDENLHLNVSN